MLLWLLVGGLSRTFTTRANIFFPTLTICFSHLSAELKQFSISLEIFDLYFKWSYFLKFYLSLKFYLDIIYVCNCTYLMYIV